MINMGSDVPSFGLVRSVRLLKVGEQSEHRCLGCSSGSEQGRTSEGQSRRKAIQAGGFSGTGRCSPWERTSEQITESLFVLGANKTESKRTDFSLRFALPTDFQIGRGQSQSRCESFSSRHSEALESTPNGRISVAQLPDQRRQPAPAARRRSQHVTSQPGSTEYIVWTHRCAPSTTTSPRRFSAVALVATIGTQPGSAQHLSILQRCCCLGQNMRRAAAFSQAGKPFRLAGRRGCTPKVRGCACISGVALISKKSRAGRLLNFLKTTVGNSKTSIFKHFYDN